MDKAEIIIEDINTGYYACKNGDIISKNGRILKPYPTGSNKYKYLSVDIYLDTGVKFKAKVVHRLVWIAFNGDIPKHLEVNHKDGDKSNNILNNLELTTHSYNCKHSFKIGLQNNKGVENPSNKIPEETALEIINRIKSGNRLVDISSDLDVSIYIIKDISRKRTWKHLWGEPEGFKEYVLCAAIWFKDDSMPVHKPKNIDIGLVVCGYRHADCISILNRIYPKRDYTLKNKKGDTTIQGFLTNHNKFVNRKEASKIAFEAGQTKEDDGNLYSEDLY